MAYVKAIGSRPCVALVCILPRIWDAPTSAVYFDKMRPSCYDYPQSFHTHTLIQRGGGIGPMKPRQPGPVQTTPLHRALRVPIPADKFWTMREYWRRHTLSSNDERVFVYGWINPNQFVMIQAISSEQGVE
jgi:hypothetical protein